MPDIDTRMTFRIDGPLHDGGDVEFDAFVDILARCSKALRMSNEDVSEHRLRPGRIRYQVVALRHDSPATVTVEGWPQPDHGVPMAQIHSAHEHLVTVLQRMRIGDLKGISEKMIDAARNLVEGQGAGFQRIGVQWGHRSVAIDADMARVLAEQDARSAVEWGTVRGRVERYNSHDRARHFYLYPRDGGRVKCVFDPSMTTKAAEVVEHDVTVTGRLKHRPGEWTPHECEVERIERHRDDGELPLMRVGMYPGITGEKSVEDHLQELRDGWD